MIRSKKCVFAAVLFSFASSFVCNSSVNAGITLSGSEYFQNFNSIGSGLPSGVEVRQVSNITNPWGRAESLRSGGIHVSWTDTTVSDFRNSASPTGSNSSGNADRLIGIHQGKTSATWTPSFFFTFDARTNKQIGLSEFKLDFDFWVLHKPSTSSTTWTVRWATASNQNITSNVIATLSPNSAGKIEIRNLDMGAEFSNSTEIKYIQIVATANTSSGTRDVFGLDNFRLKFTPQAVPEPSTAVLVGLVAIGFASFRPSRSQS